MVIKPSNYFIKRLRSILSYKYIQASYVISPIKRTTLFLPIDSKYCQIINFKLSSNLIVPQKFNYLSVGTNLNKIETLCNDTVLWYQDVDMGQVFDTKLQAFSVNFANERPDELKQYFHTSNLEGLYVFIDSTNNITNVDISCIYEDLDSAG